MADRYVSQAGSNTTPYDNWSSAANSIQTAIDAASAGETIWITNNTSYVLSAQIDVNKAVTISNFGNGSKPVIDGNGTVRCFYIHNSGAIVSGLVISNGLNSTSSAGGVYISIGTLQNSTIIDCTAKSSAGVIINGNATVTNCIITLNESTGGLFGGVGLLNAGAKLIDCIIDNNECSAERGGGAGIINGGALIDGCIFKNNTSSAAGGGLAVFSDGSIVRNCEFYNNQGTQGGGLNMTANGTVSNCTFTGNTGTSEGGAMRLDKGLVANCTMTNNTSGTGGGGGAMSRGGNSAIIRNCLIAKNDAGNYAGGVIAINANSLILENCTIADNSYYGVYDWADDAIYKTNCIVYSNTNNWKRDTQWHASCTTPAVTGLDNITDAPLFVDSSNQDYSLQSSSTCIDVGITQSWMTTTIDLANNPRLAHGVFGETGPKIVDMGAYEYNPLPPAGTIILIE